eukprot:PhF_6_TR8549/c0_g1_i1/m.13393
MSVSPRVDLFREMARKAALKTNSKHFVFVSHWDDRSSFPQVRNRGRDDNPFKNWYGWLKIRWIIQDIRVYGLKDTWWKLYYLKDAWYQKGEKILAGIDDYGNQYYYTWHATSIHNRFFIPADPHWFRGQDSNTPPPEWLIWLNHAVAHTPTQIKARGEYGPHGRGRTSPFMIHWQKHFAMMGLGVDPTFVPNQSILAPWYKTLRDTGFTYRSPGFPVYLPLMQGHNLRPEVVEEFYRGLVGSDGPKRGPDVDDLGL